MLTAVLLFILGLLLLIFGGNWFVDGATGVAKRYHIPELLIGATVVSIGTTLPEVMVSATSAAKGIGDIAYGNAIGSIICNTSLIAALTVAIKPAPVGKKELYKPVICFFIAAVFYAATAYITGYFSRITGIILLAMFIIYMVTTVREAMSSSKSSASQTGEDEAVSSDDESGRQQAGGFKESLVFDIGRIIVGAALITVGANLLVDNGTLIATALGVPTSVIALTFVALGTSLPELVTAITSLAKGHGALSLGNVIGANLFNLVLVSGVSMTIQPFHIPVEKTIAGMNASLVVDTPVMLAVMLLLTLPAVIKGKLYRAQGIALLAIYVGYIVFQFAL